ncbi:YdeI/OmpD-associated family protein [Hahella ganghwensis]|uniref:YdeI/OmpD-associated family protein n=1 Tax=Hahella ganghwensis TaxID=286420 RepID=UPI00036B9DD5|nr:YdeI/OmpD-associated family protein [Hahella ganghwensis]
MNQDVVNPINPKVDAFLDRAGQWQETLSKLRGIALDCQLTEELKWGKPCYTYQNNNVLILQGFKEFCALLFPKGALLKDPGNILEKPGDNTQAARRIPFTGLEDITGKESILKSYILEAIEVEESGLKVDFKDTSEFEFPEELQLKLNEMPDLKKAFEALTPGRQRGYLLHFSAPKQSKTRLSRVDKCVDQILSGIGLNDR